METTSGIAVRIKGSFIMISQVDALTFEKVMIAIPLKDWKLLNEFVNEDTH